MIRPSSSLRGLVLLLLAAGLAGCSARPTPVCTGAYRPFDSAQHCRPG